MNQDTPSGTATDVGILIDLGSPFNTEQHAAQNTIEECDNDEESSTKIMPEQLAESGAKQNEENLIEPETVNASEESENSQALRWSEDIPLVENEQFDFDLSLSPNDVHEDESNDDEDEVFFGPVNHREKCVRAKKEIEGDSVKPLSPLTNEQYAELFKEAIGLVMDLQQDGETVKQKKTSGETEEFISKTLETLKLSNHYDSSPDTTVDHGNKTAISESQCFKREQKKDIRSPRRQTYVVTNNTNPITELPKASECVSRLKPASNIAFKAKGAVQKSVPKLSMRSKGNVLQSKQPLPKKKQELSKSMVSKLSLRTSPPKRTRRSSQFSDEGFSDTSSITSDMSEASTSSIPIPGRKRSLPAPSKLKKSGLVVPTRTASGSGNLTKAPSNKPTLMKPGTFQRRTLTVNRSLKGEPASKVQQQPLKATLSLKSTKKTTPISKMQPATKDHGRTPQSSLSAVKSVQVRKGTPRSTLPSTPVFQERRVVPKRIMTSSSKAGSLQHTKSTSSPSSALSVKATPSTPSISNRKISASTTGSARRRSGIPTPMRSSTKSRVFSFNNVAPPSPLPMRISQSSVSSSSVSDSPVSPKVMPEIQGYISTQEQSASPVCTHVVEKVTAKRVEQEDRIIPSDARPQQLQCAKPTEKPSPAKTAVLIDLNDSKKSAVSPKVANLIHFSDTPETKEPKKNLPVIEKENLLIVI